LTIEHAAHLGAYAQLLARWILTERPIELEDDFYLLYQYNRFEASRYGLKGMMALHAHERAQSKKMPIHAHLSETLAKLLPYVQNDAESRTLARLQQLADTQMNDAQWLRDCFLQRRSLSDMMRLSSELWMGNTPPPYFQ
jgi:carboxylate-amine ligase